MADTEEPTPRADEKLIGLVVVAAADGSGPPVGSRVVAFGCHGARAARRAVQVGELALVPESVDLGDAATLPVAAVNALRALHAIESEFDGLTGRRVLVTGASGGVGRFTVQLAANLGAEVVAAVGSPERAAGLDAIGASEIVIGSELSGLSADVAAVIDNVGGAVLSCAMTRLESGGVAQAVGSSSEQPLVLDVGAERRRAGNTTLRIMTLGADSAADLEALVGLLADVRLDPQVGLRLPRHDHDAAIDALLDRRVAGKLVLDVLRG